MPPPFVIVLVAVIAVVAVFAVRKELRNGKRKAQLLVTTGFRPLERPDPQVAEPILQLYRRGPVMGRRLELWRVFHRDHPGGGMFVFDVLSPGRKSSRIVSNAVGVVSPGMGLPPFEIYAMSEQGGPMGKFVVPILTGALGQGQVVRFADLPEFARRFTVLSPREGGEAAARAFLTPTIRQALMPFQFFTLLAEGDAFALHANTLSGPDRGDEIGGLARVIEEAGEVARVLRAAPSWPAGPA